MIGQGLCKENRTLVKNLSKSRIFRPSCLNWHDFDHIYIALGCQVWSYRPPTPHPRRVPVLRVLILTGCTHWCLNLLILETEYGCVSWKCLLYRSIEARCYVENEDVVGAAPTGYAPITSEWSTSLLPTKVRSYIRGLTVYGNISDIALTSHDRMCIAGQNELWTHCNFLSAHFT